MKCASGIGIALMTTLVLRHPASAAGKSFRDLAAGIDRAIDDKLTAEKVPASPESSDADFLRRVCLDITGGIPSPEKAKAFLDSRDPERRGKLIEELLASREYGTHMADTWQALLLARPPNVIRYAPARFYKWLADSFNDGKPWNKLVHELLTATGTQDENPAVIFYMCNDSVDKLTDNVTRNLLGVQLQCAQCHNHPFTGWKQDEYWGMAAFFLKVRAENNKAVKGGSPIVGEGPNIMPRRFLPESVKFVPARLLQGEVKSLARKAPYRPVLADWVAGPKNPFLARALVNRVWAQFFGRGLVNPIDDINDQNPPSHPDLLEQLAESFAADGFDVKNLIRAITSSKAYQRSSRPTRGNEESEPSLYGRMTVRVLSPEMLHDSLARIAGPAPPPAPGKVPKPSALTPRQQFVAFFQTEEPDPTAWSQGIPQALRMMNSGQFDRSTVLDGFLREGSPEAIVERMYLTVLSRRPTPAETAKLLLYVRKGDTRQGHADILWALLNSSEFALNR